MQQLVFVETVSVAPAVESIPHLERVLVVLAALSAVEPGEVVVDPRLGGAGHVRHVGLQAPQLDLRLQRVRVAPGGPAYPILEPQSRDGGNKYCRPRNVGAIMHSARGGNYWGRKSSQTFETILN